MYLGGKKMKAKGKDRSYLEVKDSRKTGRINPDGLVGAECCFIVRLECVATIICSQNLQGSWARVFVMQQTGHDPFLDCPRYITYKRTWVPLYWPQRVRVCALVQVLPHPLPNQAKLGVFLLNRWIRNKYLAFSEPKDLAPKATTEVTNVLLHSTFMNRKELNKLQPKGEVSNFKGTLALFLLIYSKILLTQR